MITETITWNLWSIKPPNGWRGLVWARSQHSKEYTYHKVDWSEEDGGTLTTDDYLDKIKWTEEKGYDVLYWADVEGPVGDIDTLHIQFKKAP